MRERAATAPWLASGGAWPPRRVPGDAGLEGSARPLHRASHPEERGCRRRRLGRPTIWRRGGQRRRPSARAKRSQGRRPLAGRGGRGRSARWRLGRSATWRRAGRRGSREVKEHGGGDGPHMNTEQNRLCATTRLRASSSGCYDAEVSISESIFPSFPVVSL